MMTRGRFARTTATSIVTLVALALTPTAIHAGALSGTITDHTTGEGLLSATVKVEATSTEGESRGAMTDGAGRYELPDLPAGEYTLTISYVGYVPYKQLQIQVTDSEAQELDASLTPIAISVDAVTVSTSRRPEKLVDAPAAISVVSTEAVESRTALTMTEHVKGSPAVDVASNGIQQANISVRGFNKIFSGDLLVLTDNRIARVPSLRFNVYNLLPVSNDDVESIEIVSGPGSALYGPNAADGVLHIVTKSPFSSQGTTVSVGGGERDIAMGSIRHSGLLGDRVGYKISGAYQQGNDWESTDPAEPEFIKFFRPTSSGPEITSDSFANQRDFDVERLTGDARVDAILGDHTTLLVNGGFSRSSSIELTGLGAAQAQDWIYSYGQARLKYKDLHIQGFANINDAGDSYLLRTGQLIVDKSKLWAGQIQHHYEAGEKLSFTYGLDALFTRPNTESTTNGRNEEDDHVDEFGVYVQSEAVLSDQVKLIGAARVDDHSRLEDMVVSPRAGIVFQPDDHHNFRATYNRAYNTPDNNNFYLDLTQNKDPFGVGSGFAGALGFSPDIDIRVSGVPESGFHWNINDNGAQFRSPFAPLDPRGKTSADFIDFNDPIFTNVMWTAGRGAVISGFQAQLAENQVDPGTIAALAGSIDNLAPSTVMGVNNVLRTFNPDTRTFDLSTLADIADIDRLKPSITQTFELGYKGVLGERVRFGIDAYVSKKHDFIGPLTIETPNVFLDPATLQTYLTQEFGTAFADPENATDAQTLAALDSPLMGGNGNGTPIDELIGMFTSGSAQIPFGTVSPVESLDPEAVLVTYRNFGDVSYHGADLSIAFHLNQHWNAGGSYSYVSDNVFKKDDEQVHDIFLNAPRHKFGINAQFTDVKHGFNADGRLRFVDAFDMSGPFVGTTVESYAILDITAGVRVTNNARLILTVQNLLDNEHIEFVGAPMIGRLAILRVVATI